MTAEHIAETAAPVMSDPGPKPEMDWLPVARLSVDPRYQRAIETKRSRALIARLVEKFNWSAFQAIIATPNGEAWLVIDGGHRVEAARLRGETHVPAVIVQAPSLADQARIFVSTNQNRVAMHTMAIHHAKVAAGDEKALAVKALCDELGLTIPRNPQGAKYLKPGETMAIGSLGRVIADYPLADVLLGLGAVVKAYREKPMFLRAALLLAAVAVTHNADEPAPYAQRLAAFLGRTDGDWLFTRALAMQSEMKITGNMAIERLLRQGVAGAVPSWSTTKPAPAFVPKLVAVPVAAPPVAPARTGVYLAEPEFLGGMSEEARFAKAVRDGAPIYRLMAVFKIGKEEAERRAAAVEGRRVTR
jgi:hypothetical protein